MDEAMPGSVDRPASGIRRRTALAGLLGGVATVGLVGLGVSRLRGSQQTIVRPEEFAKAADGDDATPMIQAAIDRAAAAGGGTVQLTSGKTYVLRSVAAGSEVVSTSQQASLVIPAGAANVTINLNGATIEQQVVAFTFGTRYRMFNDAVMQQTRRPVARTPNPGDTSIDVADPADYPVGSKVMLVSGNVNQRQYLPIAELFQVVGTRAGAIQIDRPVRKDHRIAQGSQVGLIDVTKNSVTNIALVGPGRIVNRFRRAGNFLQVFGFRMSGVSVEACGGFLVRGHNIDVRNCQATIYRAPDNVSKPYAIAFDTGSSDIVVDEFKAFGQPFCFIHLHEGLANVKLTNIEVTNVWNPDPSWINDPAISIQGLSWNIDIENVVIDNNPQGGGIGAAQSRIMNGGNSGLTLRNVTMRGRFRNAAIAINDNNPATIDGLDVSGVVEVDTRGGAIKLAGGRHNISGLRD